MFVNSVKNCLKIERFLENPNKKFKKSNRYNDKLKIYHLTILDVGNRIFYLLGMLWYHKKIAKML